MPNKLDRVSRVPEAAMLLIAALMVIAIAVLSFRSNQHRAQASDQLRVTQEIQDASDGLLLSLVDAETGQRGFVLTGREDYLEPYTAAQKAIPGWLDRLRRVTASRPDQAPEVRILEPLVEAKMNELAHTIELRRSQSAASAIQVIDTGKGKALMTDIRAICTHIHDVTVARSAAYEALAESDTRRVILVSTVGALVLLGFLAASSLTIFRGMNRREQLFYEAASNAATLQVTLASIGDAVIATDRDARVTFFNRVAEEVTGWREAEALGRPVSQVFRIVHETTRDAVDNPLEKALATGEVVALANHTVLITKSGADLPIDDTAAPIRDDSGKTLGAVLVFRDITSRREAENQLRESNEHLRQFVAGAAHDLRSPLNSINAVAELMTVKVGESLTPEGNELLGYIRSAAQRVLRLLADLVGYAQASSFEGEIDLPVSLNSALDTALDNLRVEIEETHAEVTTDSLPSVPAREAHLVQLFQNLVGNALKYHGNRAPQIRVSATCERGEWVVQVRDNGIGIEPAYQDEIFKPFRRLHGQEYPGSGIGLAACRKIVSGYGGRIWVESTPGEGSTFSFTLPAAAKAQPA